MISPNLLEIERSILALSVEEQLWLLETIVRKIRENEYVKDSFSDTKNLDEQLQFTAIEPNIQTQITAIHDEFAISEIL
ncbi:MAG: hypothetical protein RM368_12260 [Nostoc sp. DedSLP03]|uniref:hypothetical protein n=1 Tax=Nostoc sp. DedSLP03 TaxID=3075400 RepID=UPI002AD211DD|nr:hypothetical protein [Nostoc sp. DedSLP03]MDZ7965729.1 hypothetical protein [Nostoc sp. DedSLP03]